MNRKSVDIETVKVFSTTNNGLPAESTPFSAAKDIRGDFSKIPDKFIFDGTKCWVHPNMEICASLNASYSLEKDSNKGHIKRAIILHSHGRVLIPSGLQIELPQFHSMDVRPRSGLALKFGITVLNSPGLIDEDYRGDVGIILINNSNFGVIIPDGDRIAQIKIVKDVIWDFELVDNFEDLSVTIRGEGGFNSTGTK